MNDNYPMGVNGSHPYFNQPDPPDAPYCQNKECMEPLERHWEFCPYCAWHIDWQNWDDEKGEWRS